MIGPDNFSVRAYHIPTKTMEPALYAGDHIMVRQGHFRVHDINRYDIVAFFNKQSNSTFVKRIVGLPGEKIEIKNKSLYVDERQQTESFVQHIDARLFAWRDDFGPIKLNATSFFLMGDNRDVSKDSRFYGPVDIEDISGKLLYIYMSADDQRIGMEPAQSDAFMTP
jgi:signal peptidase I